MNNISIGISTVPCVFTYIYCATDIHKRKKPPFRIETEVFI
jgi:hypothetical protein